MKHYSEKERKIAVYLDKFPRLKKITKNIYQRLQYFKNKRKNFKCELADNVIFEDVLFKNDKYDMFFGYYDKTPWSNNMRYYLYNVVIKNKIHFYYHDFKRNENYFIDSSSAWNYQQGSMLQWLSDDTVIYNYVKEDNLISKSYNIVTKVYSTYSAPIQSVSQEKNFSITLNYKRLYKLRKQYGYKKKVLNYNKNQDANDDGVFRIDFKTNKVELIISIRKLFEFLDITNVNVSKAKINHIILSPDSTEFIFMLRWFTRNGKFSALFVSDIYGNNIRVLMNDRMVSHYSWIDNEHIIVWGRTKENNDRYYKINVNNNKTTIVGKDCLDVFGDGHPTVSPNKEWILTDTYPDKSRIRHLVLYNIKSEKKYLIGSFFSPFKYNWDNRVDLHPRWSPDGKKVSVDSSHNNKRENYIINVEKILKEK